MCEDCEERKIKLTWEQVITQQYVPANNTVIFDGIGSRTAVFEL